MINKNKGYEVYFCSQEIDVSLFSGPAIILSPTQDDWNDFSYKCSYLCKIIDRSNVITSKDKLFLGFISDDKKTKVSHYIHNEKEIINAMELPPFFTLLGGMSDYRNFILKHGVNESKRLLLTLNDLVASKRITSRERFVDEATKTKVFQLAFMRDSERFFAFHNADSILDGLDNEDMSRISTNLSLSYNVAGFSCPHKLEMNFDLESILPKRISVLIGKNGLGKSQALQSLVKSLTTGKIDLSDNTRPDKKPLISRVLAISTPGDTDNTFPAERKYKKIRYLRLQLNKERSNNKSRSFGEICAQLIRSEEKIGSKYRWDIFAQTISHLENNGKIVIQLDESPTVYNKHVVNIAGKNYIPLLSLGNGKEQSLLEIFSSISNKNPMCLVQDEVYPLSSGQLAFAKFIAQSCLFIENGTLVLIDEPETHLHPNFISIFVRTLDNLLQLTGSIAVIATHSAYFIREVPRTQAFIFKSNDSGEVYIQNPRLKTFGADVGEISYFIFEDDITNALVQDIIAKISRNKNYAKNILAQLEDELSSNVIMYIKRKLEIN